MSSSTVRRRQAIFASVVLSAVPAWASTTQYQFVNLSNYGGGTTYGAYIQGISPNGNYLTGFAINSSGPETGTFASGVTTGAFLYPDRSTNASGSPNTPLSWSNVQGVAVNDNGLVAGTTGNNAFYLGGGTPTSWTNDGTGNMVASVLPLPAAYQGSGAFNSGGGVYGISNTGMVVGALGASPQKGVVYYTSGPQAGTAVIYDSLPYTGNPINTIQGISADGNWMVGDASVTANASQTIAFAYNFSSGQWYTSIGPSSARTTLVRAVNINGEATGSTDAGAFTWTPSGGMTTIPLPSGGSSGVGRALNDNGWVVGSDYNAVVAASNGGYNSGAAFVYNGSQSYLLNDLIGASAGNYMIDYATGISNNGIIVGSARNGVYGSGVIAFAMVPVAGSSLVTWAASGSGSWDNASNWSDAIPNSTVTAITLGQTVSSASTVTLGASRTVNGVTFDSPYSYTVAATGGATLTLQSGLGQPAYVSVSAGNHAISAPVILGSPVVASVAGSYVLSFTGPIIGSGSFTASGPGIVVLSGSDSYTGTTTVTGGSLRAVDGVGLPASSQLTLSGGVYESSGTFVRSFGTAAGQFSIPGGTTGLSAYGGPLTVAAGGTASPAAITWGSATFNPSLLTLNGTYANSALTWENPINLGGAGRTISVLTNTVTMTGAITGDSNSSLTKTGPGLLVLTGTNTWAGGTVVTGGMLRGQDGVNIPAAGNLLLNSGILETGGTFSRALGTGSGQVQLIGGTSGFSASTSTLTVNLGGAGATINWGNTSSTTFSPTELALNAPTAQGNIVLVNPINLGTSTSIGRGIYVGAGTATLSGALVGAGQLIKDGPGLLAVAPTTSTFSGSVIINGGELKLPASTKAPVPLTITVNQNGTFDPSAYANPLTLGLTGSLTISSGYNYNYSQYPYTSTVASGTVVGNITGTGLVLFNSGAPFTFPNSLGGALQITIGSGPVNLTGSDVYTGNTLVNQGGTIRGNLSPNSFLNILGGYYEGAGTFTRPLASSGAGNLSMNAGTNAAGFSALGGPLTVAIGGTANPTALTWGSALFSMGAGVNGSTGLVLNTGYADSALTFANPLDLGDGPSATTRFITVNASTATMTGVVSGVGSSLWKNGGGTLVLNNAETFTGTLSVTQGTVAVGPSGSFVGSISVSAGATLDASALGAAGLALAPGTTLTAYNQSVGAGTSSVVGNISGAGTVIYSGFSGVNVASSGNISGANNLTITGPNYGGIFTFNGSLTYSGNTTVNHGETLVVNNPLRTVNGTLSVTGTGTQTSTVILAGTGVAGEFGSISASAYGVVRLPVSVHGAGGNAKVLVTTGLDLGNDGFNNFSGTVDLTDNDMIVRNSSLATVMQFVTSANDGGAWDQPGITSSLLTSPVGSALYCTLAVVSNDAGDGVHQLFSTFDGVPLGMTDVMVKYTYYGDADLSGYVDGNDVAQWINGYNTGLTGWQNGDFNNDGVVDMNDFNLMIQSIQNESTSFSWNTGGGSAVPEPGQLALLALAAPAMLTRRRRA